MKSFKVKVDLEMDTIAKWAGLGLLLAVIAGMAGCSDMMIPGLRYAPDEPQKQSAAAAVHLADRLAVTGARPGSSAGMQLARLTKPAAAYAGRPETELDIIPIAAIERNQWRYKADQVTAAKLRDTIRRKTQSLVNASLSGLATDIANDTDPAKMVDRMAAIASVSVMGDELAASIPDPVDPDTTRTPAEARMASDLAAAATKIAQAAQKIATARPTAAAVVDKTLDAVEKTAEKTIVTVERSLELYQKFAPEFMAILGAAGIGLGGYAVKKKRDEGRAKGEAEKQVAAAVTEIGGQANAQIARVKADLVAKDKASRAALEETVARTDATMQELKAVIEGLQPVSPEV